MAAAKKITSYFVRVTLYSRIAEALVSPYPDFPGVPSLLTRGK